MNDENQTQETQYTEQTQQTENTQQTSTNSTANKGKLVLAYIIPLLGIIFVNTEKNATPYEREHYAQAATIFIVLIALSIVTGIISGIMAALNVPFIGNILSLLPTAIEILSIIAAVKSTSGEVFKIPVIYDFSQKIFGKKN